MENKTGIYEVLNTTNGKRYIGQASHIRKRWEQHRWHLKRGLHHSSPLQRAWDKYGEAAFKFRVILTCAVSMLDFYEQQLLDKVRPEYNLAPVAGSSRGVKHPPRTAEQRATNARAQLGKRHTLESRKHMSDVFKGRVYSKDAIAKSAASRTGGKRSDEARRNMSLAQIGKKRSPEHCAAMSAARMGLKLPSAHCANVSAGKRAASDAKHPPSVRTLQRRAAFDAGRPW